MKSMCKIGCVRYKLNNQTETCIYRKQAGTQLVFSYTAVPLPLHGFDFSNFPALRTLDFSTEEILNASGRIELLWRS